MLNNNILNNTKNHDTHNMEATKLFGFWIYLMSDCILFATLFAVYMVLSKNVACGPDGKDIFELSFVLIETFLLLFSSVTYNLVILAMHNNNIIKVNLWLFLTALFGLSFVYMEIYEFYHLIIQGYGPNKSAFLSSFFTLIGTHGLHVMIGIIWIILMIIQVYCQGLTLINRTRLQCLSMFWHFLDIIWICLFTIVYLIGVL